MYKNQNESLLCYALFMLNFSGNTNSNHVRLEEETHAEALCTQLGPELQQRLFASTHEKSSPLAPLSISGAAAGKKATYVTL